METPLPSFRKPPLVETAISLQFQLVDGLKNAHLAIFWEGMRKEFPKVTDAQLLPEQIELFGEDALRTRGVPGFRIAGAGGASRMQMASEDDQAMVQIQNGRIISNWRRGAGGEYPRWGIVLSRFKESLDKFKAMLAAENLGAVSLNQWEVVYVNHLLKGRDWDAPTDWPDLLPGLVAKDIRYSTGILESVACGIHIVMPDNRGRIHAELFHGFNSPGAAPQELLSLQITARGGVCEFTDEQAYNGLELGHVAIVQAFCDLTGPEAQKKWEREV